MMAQITETVKRPSKISIIKFSFSKEKFALLVSLLLAIIILLCVIIILFMAFNVSHNNAVNKQSNNSLSNNKTEQIDVSSLHEEVTENKHKIIYRDKWGGRSTLYERPAKLPIKYIIISHTAGAFCETIEMCSKQMKQIQSIHVAQGSPDIGYNFLVGGDGNIYVGRGWNNHNFHMNLDTIGISFLGNYLYDTLSPRMIGATQDLLKIGVENGKLEKDYVLLAHNHTYNTASPGPNVYKQIHFWPHFSNEIINDIE